MIKDDQALVAYIEGKGLVIISGCGHAGIINTINYAKKLEETKRLCSSWRLSPVRCTI
jgi:7,8-dihydropterin-6-yl-methyl-4-(beta-D-ribofuranosyl)aminobenzene 5'-phosphate synthase